APWRPRSGPANGTPATRPVRTQDGNRPPGDRKLGRTRKPPAREGERKPAVAGNPPSPHAPTTATIHTALGAYPVDAPSTGAEGNTACQPVSTRQTSSD